MNPWIPVLIGIAINIAAVGVAYGKITQSVTDLKRRMGVSDEAAIRRNDKTDKWEVRMENKEHFMLPTCMQEFKEINTKLGALTGKVDTLIELNKK